MIDVQKKLSNPIFIAKLKMQVKLEREEGELYTKKWMNGRDDNADYFLGKGVNPKKSKQVHVRSCYRMLKSLEALFYMDEKKIDFSVDDVTGAGADIAELFNKLAEFDYKLMKKHLYDWKQVVDGLTYGRGVKRIKGWDSEKNLPMIETLNPCACVFDPEELLDGTNRRFFGVLKDILISDIRQNEEYFNLGFIKQDDIARKKVDLYHHYTMIDGVTYLTTWINGGENLVRIVEFEKDSNMEGNFGISIFEPFPVPGRIGADLIELGVNYQMYLEEIINLLLIQANRDALGEDRLVNMDMGVDIDELARPSIRGKNIPVDDTGGQPLSNAVYVLESGKSRTQAENSISLVRQIMQESTGVNEATQGFIPDKNMTKGENQNVQANANTQFSMIGRFLMLGEESFWKAYVYFYRYNFKGQKNVVIQNKYKTSFEIITRQDITAKEFIDFNIKIESKIEKIKTNLQRFQQMITIMPFSEAYMSDFGKLNAHRELWELAGVSKDSIDNKFPMTPDERIARMYLIKLNQNEKIPKPQPNENHEVFDYIFSSGLPTVENIKERTIRQILMMNQKELEGENQENPNAGQMKNIAQAQAGNSLSQQASGEVISNLDANAI